MCQVLFTWFVLYYGQSSSASEKIPLDSYVGLDFVVGLRMVECQSLCRYKKKTPYSFVNIDRISQLPRREGDKICSDYECTRICAI